MIFALFLVFLAVLITGFSQVLLKIGSTHQGKRKNSILSAYLNLPTLSAYGLLLLVTILSVIALNEIPLKMFYAIASLGFVIVPFFSWGLLGERINIKIFMGTILVILGICIFNLL